MREAAAYTLFASGFLIVLWTTFLINHFDLFGLRQVWLYLRGIEYTKVRFMTPDDIVDAGTRRAV